MRRLVILLHGVNARGRDVASLTRGWRLPGTVIVAPDAPFRSDESPDARQWFSIRGITPQTRPERVLGARGGFDGIIAAAMEAQGLAGRPDRLALIGFSQGAIMALDAVASGRWPAAAVVAFSGRYATPDPQPAHTPALVIHGAADPAIPVSESLNARACLHAAGCRVDLAVQPGVGHWVSPEGAAMAEAFLRRAFGVPPQA
ncbi:MAG: prolyl oligopeptidase family serine peptidase [Paracoccaceae bacterium]